MGMSWRTLSVLDVMSPVGVQTSVPTSVVAFWAATPEANRATAKTLTNIASGTANVNAAALEQVSLGLNRRDSHRLVNGRVCPH